MNDYYIALEGVRKAYAGTHMADIIYTVTRNFHHDFWAERIIGMGESMVKIRDLRNAAIPPLELTAIREVKRVAEQYA